MQNKLMRLALVGSLLGGACAGEADQNEQLVKCSGSAQLEVGDMCMDLNDRLPYAITNYEVPEEGIYRFRGIFWDSTVYFNDDPTSPPGVATINISVEKGPNGESILIPSLTNVEIAGGLSSEQQAIVLEKEVVGHAKAIAFVLETYPEVFDRDSELRANALEFIDKLSHLAIDEESLRKIGFAEGYEGNIPYWDGGLQLSDEILEFLAQWNADVQEISDSEVDIQPIIDLYY